MQLRDLRAVSLVILTWSAVQAAGQQLPTAAPRDVGMAEEGIAKIGPFVRQLIAARELAGAVTIVARRGKVVHFEAHGMSNIAARQPMRKDSIFRIYSMTKAIVSVAAMVLVEEGRLELDAPVSKYVPAVKRMKVTGRPQTEEMTIRDLLRHTAGFPTNVTVDRALRDAGYPALRQSTLAETMDRLEVVSLKYQPGTDWHYSFATEVLARAMEVASGQLLDVCLAECVLKPLGMGDTGFYVPAEKRDRLSTIYGKELQVVEAPQPGTTGPFAFERAPKFLSAGGGLVSTAEDYMRFCLMLSNQGELDGVRLLQAETVHAMTRNQLPVAVGEISRKPEGRGFGLGFAVRVRRVPSAPSSLGEYEWLGGAGTEFWLVPTEELAVITLTQRLPMFALGQALKPIIYAAIE